MIGSKIDTREELINALTEAAELEHGLLCQYLFAAFSMKKHPTEDATWPQLELVRSWEAHILRVAREEMAHLGTVTNLLTAIGGAPQFRRPNFPQPSRYFPEPSEGGVGHVEFALEAFSARALERFIRFETPEEELRLALEAIAPDPIEYVTVGDLYGQIREAFEILDERELFIGPRAAQDTDDWSANLKLRNVVDRATAVAAIDDIIEEGEAAPEKLPTSHWATFVRISQELDNEVKQNPNFDPARPVVPNPLTRQHRDSSSAATTIINDPDTLEIAELFNAVYGTMMLMLMQFYAFAGESTEQREGLRATARQMMSGVVRPLGEILTLLPARDDLPGKTAGPGFEFYTDLRVPSNRRNSWMIIHERLAHEAEGCKRLALEAGAPQRLAFLQENLEGLARNTQRYMSLEEL